MKSRLQYNFALTLTSACPLFFVLSLTFVSSSIAEELINITDIKDCRAISDEQQRLVCYDTVMDGGVFNEQKIRQKQVEVFGSRTMAIPDPVVPATSEPSSTVTTVEAPKKSKKDKDDSLAVTIVRTKKDGNGFYYFQTSEGQVWKQQNASRWTIDTPFEADIRPGALGSFFLEVEGSKGTRVKRMR